MGLNWLQKKFCDWAGIEVNPITVDYNTFDIADLSPSAMFGDYSEMDRRLRKIFSNPALLKVISLQCDLFSLGEVYVYDKNGVEVKQDPIIDRINNPNPLQTKSQFLWDYMFWNMLGTDYLYVDSNINSSNTNKLYFLQPDKIEWPADFNKNYDKLIFSQNSLNELNKTLIGYRYSDGTGIQIPLSKVIIITDLTNGTGNWFKGNSRINALWKMVDNSEASLDSKNINIKYAGKFMVAGQADPNDTRKLPMGESEKQDIETKMNSRKRVHAVKSMIDIKRFVEDMGALKLDESYLADYFAIGNMYNIPRDVLEASLQGSTYENQEKSTGRHVAYTLQPKGNELMLALANKFGYDDGRTVVMSWDHLPFMQVFEADRATVKSKNIVSFANLINIGVPLDEVNKYLDLNFSNATANAVSSTGTLKGSGTGQGQESTGASTATN
jgi:hypothetical protein